MSGTPFSFETRFSETGDVIGEDSASFRKYSREDLEKAAEAARAEGEASVLAQAEREIAAAVSRLAEDLAPVVPAVASVNQSLKVQAGQLALDLARKLAGKALDKFPEETVKAVLDDAEHLLPKGPKLRLVVAPGLTERLQTQLSALAADAFEIDCVEDAGQAPGSWSVQWADGEVGFDRDQVNAELEKLVEQHLADPVEVQGELFGQVA